MRAALALAATLLMAAPALGQVVGTAYVDVSGPLCAAIRAELSAIGVPTAESRAAASWAVECDQEVRLVGPSGAVSRPRDGADDRLASEVAEYIRAQLLVAPPAAHGLSTPPPPRLPPNDVLAPNNESAPSAELPSAELPSVPTVVSTVPETRLSSDVPEAVPPRRVTPQRREAPPPADPHTRFSLSVALGLLTSGGAIFPALTLAAEPRLYVGDISIGAHVGTSLVSPALDLLAGSDFGDPLLGVSVQARLMDLGLDVMYAHRVASTPLRLGIGGGISVLRLRLTGQGGEVFGLQDQTSIAWAPLPYVRAGAMLRAHSRIQIRLEGRLGWVAREMVVSVPLPVEPLVVVAGGVAAEVDLSLEVFIR